MKRIDNTRGGLLLVISLSLFGCTNNLDLQPTSQISTTSFWKTEDDARGALNGMYARMRDQFATNYFLWGEARSEVMNQGVGGSPGYNIYYENQLIPTNSGPTWQGLYTIVHDANLILKYVPQITFLMDADKQNILAQAYTTRAFIYFLLAKTWGDAIVITEPMEGFSAESIQRERTPVTEVFTLIKNDLAEAQKLFSDDNYPEGRNKWSKPALNALTADVYLWTAKRMNGGDADLNIALNALDAIEQSDVELLDDFGNVFDYSNKGNKEIIMAIRYEENESGSTLYEYMYISSVTLPANVDQATRDAIGAFKYDAWTISPLVRSQFTEGDQRRNASFLDIYTIDDTAKTYFGSIVTKFNGIETAGTRLFVDDIVLYRYADVLLMKAEAKSALNQDPSAEINAVRKRAYGDNFEAHRFTSSNRIGNDDAILKERLLELTFEGKRWWDLIRFGKAFELVPSLQDRVGQDYLLLFPISETTLSLETKVIQNSGY